METIIIEINSFSRKIHKIIDLYPLDGLISIQTTKFVDRTIYMININDKSVSEQLNIYNWTTRLIHNIILKAYGEKITNKRIIKLLKVIGKDEKDKIIQGVNLLLYDDNICTKEKNIIKNEILDLLLENNQFNIDGYLRFQSTKIEKLIDKSIELVMDNIEMESEYNEFIDMLQFYVDGQIPIMDLVNVIIDKNEFKLLDAYNNKIENQSIDEVVEDIDYDNISSSDLLVSSLIVLSPKKIVVHIENDIEEDLLNVLKQIFRDRLSVCYGCNICRVNIKKNNDSD